MTPRGTNIMLPIGAILLALVALALRPVQAEETCELHQVFKVDMTLLRDGRESVPMSVGGQTVNMLIDTGGLFSMLTPPSVVALGYPPLIIPSARITQYGGLRIDHYVRAQDVALGGMKSSTFQFLIMPERGYPPDIGGVLAPDILSSYDADFDFANATFKLFLHDHCAGQVVYWTSDPHGEVEIELNDYGQISVPVTLDGKEIRATIDTGGNQSFASLETIEDDFNLNEKSPDLNLLPRATPDAPRYHYPFKMLSLQSITVNNPDLVLVPDDQSKLWVGAPKLILGMNILRQLHLYIAYRERVLYVTPAAAH
jgi:hypothetical protein